VQFPERRQRQQEDEAVGGQAHGRREVPDGKGVEAVGGGGRDDELDRDAGQAKQDVLHNSPCDHVADGPDAYPADRVGCEDAAVLEQERDLDDVHAQVVHQDGNIEVLSVAC